jgi:hypothetical protein
MAEQARAKRVAETELSQDDPLSELANIMGMTDEQQLGVGADEIELELERELLGEATEDQMPARTAPDDEAEAADTVGSYSEETAADTSIDDKLADDLAFDDELADELAGVLAEMDDQDNPGGDSSQVESDADYDGEDTIGSASNTEQTTDDDPFREIFGQSNHDLEQAGDDQVTRLEPVDDTVSESGEVTNPRAADPYAAEYQASLDDSREDDRGSDDAELENELVELLGAADDEDETVLRADENDLVDDLRALAETADAASTDIHDIEPGENDLDASDEAEEPHSGAVAEFDDDNAGEISAVEEQETPTSDVESGVTPDAEVVGWDGQNIPQYSSQAADADSDVENADEADDAEGTLDDVFGDVVFSEEETEGEPDGSQEPAHEEVLAEQDSGEGDDNLEQHFDERMAALFGRKTPAPAMGEEDVELDTSGQATSSIEEVYESELADSGDVVDEAESVFRSEAGSADEDMASEPLSAVLADEATDYRSAGDDDEERVEHDLAGSNDDIPAEQPALLVNEEAAEYRIEHGTGDANLDALAALERAVSDLNGLNKPVQSAWDNRAPEVETISIEEDLPPAQDDFGVPDLPEPEELAKPVVFDDIESEITAGFDGPAIPKSQRDADETGDDDMLKEFDAIFDDDLSVDSGSAEDADDDAKIGTIAAATATGTATTTANFDRWSESSAAQAESGAKKRSVRGPLMAAVVGGVAVIGAIGAYFYFNGGSGGSKPVVIAADNQPVKVKPADPGGKTVPNQDNKVYQRVSGDKAEAAPQQKELVSTKEEPVDIARRAADTEPAAPASADANGNAPTTAAPAKEEGATSAADTAPKQPVEPSDTANMAATTAAATKSGGKDEVQQAIEASEKSDERLLPGVEPIEMPQSENVAVLAPQRVRTMIVKPDGTLVERPQDSQAAGSASTQSGEKLSTVSPNTAKELDDAAKKLTEPVNQQAENPVETPAAGVEAKTQAEASANGFPVTTEQAPVVPARPANQPVTVVGSTKETESAASTAPAQTNTQVASTAATSGYTVQIASQPSRDAAQQTSANLAKRYETVIGNRQIAIVPAEISGKGTYYRVRVAAQSLADANDLCTRYKAAGGDCFVARP